VAEIDTVLRSARTYLVQTSREIETTAGIEGGPSMDNSYRDKADRGAAGHETCRRQFTRG
jgi:hypothetical protein